MSWQLSAANGVIRALAAAIRLRGDRTPDTSKPSLPSAKLDSRVVEINGVRCVWINEASRSKGIVVYLHGGAYVAPALSLHWDLVSYLSEGTGMAGLFVEYTLAPKASFPVARDEVLAVIAALRLEADVPIVIGGDSAGGGLALSVSLALHDAGLELPRALALSSPWLDVTVTNPAALAFEKHDVMISSESSAKSGRAYAGKLDPRTPGISPLFADVAGLPPMILHVSTKEMLQFECREFAAKCVAAGVECELVEVPKVFHAWVVAVNILPEARVSAAQQVAFLNAHL